MNIFEWLAPIKRNLTSAFVAFAIIFGSIIITGLQVPETEKITLYYSVKPTGDNTTYFDAPESSMKIAEMMAGWAKNPGFRNQILKKAEADIPKFKKKLSANKQNRTNVFWTITFSQADKIFASNVVDALEATINVKLNQYNANNPYPFEITAIDRAGEIKKIPFSWILVTALFGGAISFFTFPFLREQFFNTYLYEKDIQNDFPTIKFIYNQSETPEKTLTVRLGRTNRKIIKNEVLKKNIEYINLQ